MALDTAIPFLRAPVADVAADNPIRTALRVARETLGMEVSFFAELTDRHMVFRALDGDPESFGWHEDQEVPLGAAYCTLMVKGELPEVVPDSRADPVAASRAATSAANIGAYVGVPVWDGAGRLYGSLCCLSHEARPELQATEARFLRGFAQLVSEQLDRERRVLSSFRQIVETTSDGIWTADVDGCSTFVNAATLRLLGRSSEEVLGRPMLDFFAPEAHEEVARRHGGAAGGERDAYVATLLAKDGSRRTVRIGSVPMTQADGQLAGSLATLTDITEQRRAEERTEELNRRALREAEGKFRSLADLVPHQIWTARPDGTVNFVNRRALGYLGGEGIRAAAGDWTACVHPGDRRAASEAWRAALATGEPFDAEYRLRRHDGTYRLHKASAFATRDEDGRVQRWYGMSTDVTDARAQERLSDLIAASQDAIIGEDLEGRITSWNAAAERIFGYAADEVLGRPASLLLAPESASGFDAMTAGSRAGAPMQDPAARRRRKDGRDVFVAVSLSPVLDSNGRVTGASVIARDVTDQLRSAAQLRTSEARLLEAQRVARLGSWEVDLDTHEVTCSDEARRLLRLPPAPVPLSPEDLVGAVAPHDRERIRGSHAERAAFSYDHMVAGDDRTIVHAQGRVVEDPDGRRRRLGTVQDVTEARLTERALRASQARLTEAQRVARIGDFVWEAGTDAVMVSDEMARLAGVPPGEPLPLAVYFARIPETERRDVERAMRRAGAAGRSLDQDVPMIRPDGSRLTVNVRGEIALDADGRPERVTGTVQDVTASRAAEAAMQARDHAERANRAKSEFLSRMSHELRTPLNAILGFGQLLELDELGPDSADSVAHIMRAGRHLLELIDEVLDLSRIEAGALRITLEPVDVAPVVDEVLGLAAPLAGEEGIELSAHLPPGLSVQADRQRLRQVLLNLVSNAIKYNRPAGSVRVRARMEGAHVGIAVEDTGLGIAPADLPKLFSPFERLDADAGSVGGTGLGLAVSRSLCDGMGGALDATSEPGQGSTFTVVLHAAI